MVTMRATAAVFEKLFTPLSVAEVEVDAPGPGEALVKIVATGLGWVLDRWLGTRPWGTIVLFFLGVGAGMLSVYRAVTGIKMAVGSRPLAKADPAPQPAKDDWDDDEA